jgi:hypothetical protein
MDPTLVADLRRLDDAVNADENHSIRARWEFGRRILAFYLPPESTRKQLPKGVLDALSRELRVHRSEVGARMKFAKTYQTEQQLSTVIESFRSWSAIKQQALTDTTHTSTPKKTPYQRALALLDHVGPETLTPADLPDIVAVFKVLKGHRDSILERQRKAA